MTMESTSQDMYLKLIQLFHEQRSDARNNARADIRRIYATIESDNTLDERKDADSKNDESVAFGMDASYVIAELDVLDPHLAGYISRLHNKTYIAAEIHEWIEILRRYDLAKLPRFQKWYVEESSKYPKLRLYINALDYLRLKLLEYLESMVS